VAACPAGEGEGEGEGGEGEGANAGEGEGEGEGEGGDVECATDDECEASFVGNGVCADDGECNEGNNERCVQATFGETQCVVAEAPGDLPCNQQSPDFVDVAGHGADGSTVHFCAGAAFCVDAACALP
jgi:hypothetical protein